MLDEPPEQGSTPRTTRAWSQTAIVRWLPMIVIAFAALATPFIAPAAETLAGPGDEALRSGAEVYNEACSACHQPGGAGLAGQFPPLAGNPNIDDAAYIESAIRNGLSGEIDVNGEIYDGVMPAQSTLSDEDITNVIAYIQSGFAAPAAPVTEITAAESDGGGLPAAVVIGFYVALLIGALAFAPRIIAANDPREISWFDAWLKAAVIVVGLIVATTLIPARVIESEALQDVSRNARDLITVGVWSVGLAGSLFLLWYAHRKNRI
jgi:mono/diheme cytochrome c family protein